MKNLSEIASKILNKWRDKLEELDNEEGAEYLDFDICESIMVGTIHEEMLKWYNRSDGDKHQFIRIFLNTTEDEIKKAKLDADQKGDEQ